MIAHPDDVSFLLHSVVWHGVGRLLHYLPMPVVVALLTVGVILLWRRGRVRHHRRAESFT